MQNLTWTLIEPDWDIEQVRRASTKLIATYKFAIWRVLNKHPELMEELHDSIMEEIINDINSKGIKTPIAFVRYLAELTVNLGGGKVSIAGNEKEACISYDEIPSWEQMKQKYLLDDVSEERLVRLFRQTVERFGEKLGFSCNVDAKLSHPVATIIFKAPLKKTV